MDQLLADYKLYYKTRMDRYENDPLFKHSFMSEQALYRAMESCNDLADFKDKIGDLNIKNAIALVKDQETAKLNHYKEIKENIRAVAPQQILEKIDTAKDENEVVTITTDIEQKSLIAISIDGFLDAIWLDFIPMLEKLDIIKSAEMPAKHETDRQREITEIKTNIAEKWADMHKNARQREPTWVVNLDTIWEHRHRKKIPINDTVLTQRMNELKNLI